MPDLDRRTVKPAHADAYIPDPARGGKLPPEGAEVNWNHYWQGHLDKGNVLMVDTASAGFTAWAAANLPAVPAATVPPAEADAAH